MAITDPLATVDEYIALREFSGDTTVLQRQLEACSRLFEKEARQFFTKDAAVIDRVWVAKWPDYLDVWGTRDGCPGIATASGLVIKEDTDDDGSFSDETAWASTDYELLPRHSLMGTEQRPYDCISIPTWSTKSFRPGGRYQVTAVYGWPSVPAGVKEDVIELCSIWRLTSQRATSRVNDLNEVVSMSPLAASLVSRIRDTYRQKVTF